MKINELESDEANIIPNIGDIFKINGVDQNLYLRISDEDGKELFKITSDSYIFCICLAGNYGNYKVCKFNKDNDFTICRHELNIWT